MAHAEGGARVKATTTASHMALVGTARLLTLRQVAEPGSAPSRENANTMRAVEPTAARPPHSCATMMIRPATPETQMERTMAFGANIEACVVSSDMCAEAS